MARIGLFSPGSMRARAVQNDPTPVQPHHEYCVVQLEIEYETGETKVRLIDE